MKESNKEKEDKLYAKKIEYSRRIRDKLIAKAKEKGFIERKKIPTHSKHQEEVWKKDKLLYKKVWEMHPSHKCEECDLDLGHEFEDDTGKVLNIWKYSHIYTKAAYPKLRWLELNVNYLCKEHHSQWEFSTQEERAKMKIYDKNRMEKLLNINKLSKNK